VDWVRVRGLFVLGGRGVWPPAARGRRLRPEKAEDRVLKIEKTKGARFGGESKGKVAHGKFGVGPNPRGRANDVCCESRGDGNGVNPT